MATFWPVKANFRPGALGGVSWVEGGFAIASLDRS